MARLVGFVMVMAVLAGAGPARAFYSMDDYARDRVRADADPRARAILDARIDGVASGLFTANGLRSDGMYREGSFCLSYNVTLSMTDFYALLDTRLLEYRKAGLFDRVKSQSVAATLEFELRRHYPCGRDRGDPFPKDYVFPDGTPASVYRMTPPGQWPPRAAAPAAPNSTQGPIPLLPSPGGRPPPG